MSGTVAPGYNMQLQNPNVNGPNYEAVANVLSQLHASVAPTNYNMQSQKMVDPNHNAVNPLSHLTTAAIPQKQPTQTQIHANYAQHNNQIYVKNNYTNGDKNGNTAKAEDVSSKLAKEKLITARNMHKATSTPKNPAPGAGSTIRKPRAQQLTRREAGNKNDKKVPLFSVQFSRQFCDSQDLNYFKFGRESWRRRSHRSKVNRHHRSKTLRQRSAIYD